VASRAGYDGEGKAFMDEVCVTKQECLTFTLRDSFGDGLSGDSYSVTVDGSPISGLSGAYLKAISREFGACSCPSGEQKFELAIKTDNYGYETSYRIKRKNNAGKFRGKIAEQVGFESNGDFELSKCLPDDRCYKFFIFDENRDGICCGFGEGSYSVTWNGTVKKSSSFEDKRRETSPAFGSC